MSDIVVTRGLDGAAVIRLYGEVDLATAETTAVALDRAADGLPPPGPVVLDLTGLDFLAVAGIRAIQAFTDSCAERGILTRVVAQPDGVAHRLYHLLGFRPQTPTYDSVEQALRNEGTRPAHCAQSRSSSDSGRFSAT